MSKTKDTPIHRYALVDKTGKTRLTCRGTGPKAHKGAAAAFKRQRGGNPIPEGWKVVDRGPVEPAKAEPTPNLAEGATPGTTTAAPRPFKVGDKVRGKRWSGRMATGVIHRFDFDGDPFIGPNIDSPLLKLNTVVLLEPAPAAAPEPAPRPFQVGDIVEGRGRDSGELKRGVFLGFKENGHGKIQDPDDLYYPWIVLPETIRLAEPKAPAPEPAPGPLAPLDPQAEKLLEEARESLAAANAELEAYRKLGEPRDFAQMRDFYTVLQDVAAELPPCRLLKDAPRLVRELREERDRLQARVKELETPLEILGTISITRRGNRMDMHRHMTDKGTSLKRDEFAALVALMVSHASTMAEELAGGEVTEARKP